jgi:hypothetical protein
MVDYASRHSQTIVLVNHQTELEVTENLHQAPAILRTMGLFSSVLELDRDSNIKASSLTPVVADPAAPKDQRGDETT